MNGTRYLALSAVLAGIVLVFTAFNAAEAQQRRGIQFTGPSQSDGPRGFLGQERPGRAGGFGFGGEDFNPLERLIDNAERFDLTDDQIAALADLAGSAEAEREAVKAARETLKEVAMAEEIDTNAIRVAADELGDAIGELVVKAVTIKSQVEAILTDEQLAQVEEVREKMQERFGSLRDRFRSLFGRGGDE